MLTIPYEEVIQKYLDEPNFVAGYLTTALEEGEDVFLIALRHVSRSKCGMTALAKASNLNRENLYDMLSKDGNPRLSSIVSILDSLGFKIEFLPKNN